MDRYNPFAADPPASPLTDDIDPFSNNPIRRQLSSSLSAATQSDTKKTVTIVESPRKAQTKLRQQRQDSIGSSNSSRYSTSFPDPFGEVEAPPQPPPPPPLSPLHSRLVGDSAMAPRRGSPPSHQQTKFTPLTPIHSTATTSSSSIGSNRSNSVTSLPKTDYDEPQQKSFTPTHSSARHPIQRGASTTRSHSGVSGFGSFLSRATSVTSSSVTDRVSGAVGSVRGAVDSLSSQFQQAVPVGLGGSDRAASVGGTGSASAANASNLFATVSSGADKFPIQQQQQQQQSAASYLASKLSSATNQFVGAASGSSSQSGSLMPVICRQRVVLIVDSVSVIDWAQQFNQYRRLVSGQGSSTSSAFTSFITSQFSSVSGSSDRYQGGGGADVGGDLIEQTDFTDISVLANQSSSTATVYVSGQSALGTAPGTHQGSTPSSRLSMSIGVGGRGDSGSGSGSMAKIIRPEYVVVRQRGEDKLDHLRGVVKALNYCLVPMFEPYETWNIFQDRQLIFAKLLRVQKQLGKQNFPLVPQIYCQTHQDLLNYINNSSIVLPCLVRTGQLGKGKIRIDNLQMLKDFATIMATSEQSCTIEPYLEVKCDLIVQRLGTSLKLFKSNPAIRKDSSGQVVSATSAAAPLSAGNTLGGGSDAAGSQYDDQFGPKKSLAGQQSQESAPSGAGRQSASRQTSLGSGVLSSLISTTSSGLQQVALGRRASNPAVGSWCAFEKMADVNSRYRDWIEAIAREFDNKIDAFCIKIVVASNDREYIVGLRNCSMNFLGNQENQEEDRRSFVELIITKMNTILPKHQLVSRESSALLKGNDSTSSIGGGSSNQMKHTNTSQPYGGGGVERTNSDDQQLGGSGGVDKRNKLTFVGKSDAAGGGGGIQSNGVGPTTNRIGSYGTSSSSSHLISRNRSVSMNQGEVGSEYSSGSVGGMSQGAAHANGAGKSQVAGYYLPRRGSDRMDSSLATDDDYDDITGSSGPTSALSQTISSSGATGPSTNQRQLSLSQSIFDQTSTAFSSFQKQSLSFLKRLDSRTGADLIGGGVGGSNTPPQSAKSDTGFDRNFAPASSSVLARAESSAPNSTLTGQTGSGGGGEVISSPFTGEQAGTAGSNILTRPGVKSQSIDAPASSLTGSSAPSGLQGLGRGPPPKPPPPPPETLMNRQSSLVNYSSANRQQQLLTNRQRQDYAPRQNSPATNSTGVSAESLSNINMPSSPMAAGTVSGAAASTGAGQQRQTRVVRQNSALSAFEPFDPDLRCETSTQQQQQQQRQITGNSRQASTDGQVEGRVQQQQQQQQQRSAIELASGKKRPIAEPYDTVSVNSGNSNSTDETTTAEDTMNNLKKTFASIFGDKCE